MGESFREAERSIRETGLNGKVFNINVKGGFNDRSYRCNSCKRRKITH